VNLPHTRGWQPFRSCVKEVEETIEEMLIRLDEFCGVTDVIRSDTSQILDETIPLIKAKVVEMNNIYAKVDKLEVCYIEICILRGNVLLRLPFLWNCAECSHICNQFCSLRWYVFCLLVCFKSVA
uniref:Breast carcinoma amplified sequence 4 n=1 Tax=Chelonoidis abingdonii TaxID=106734 RepID=A0A8C0HDN3_CHEAB